MDLRIVMLGDKARLHKMQIVEMVYHLGMLHEHALGATNTIATAVCRAWDEVANECLDGEHDGVSTLGIHTVMHAMVMACCHANGQVYPEWLAISYATLVATSVEEARKGKPEWGTNEWFRAYQCKFLQMVEFYSNK